MDAWEANANTIEWRKLNTAWEERRDTRVKEIAAANTHNAAYTGGKEAYDKASKACVEANNGPDI